MDNLTKLFLLHSRTLFYKEEKAIANFMFREIIEDAHIKYNNF